MTGFTRIDPKNPLEGCLENLQSVAQQLSIERAHQMEVLSSHVIFDSFLTRVKLLKNREGISLELSDEERLSEVCGQCLSWAHCLAR